MYLKGTHANQHNYLKGTHESTYFSQRDTQINIIILKGHINQHNYLKGTYKST